MTVQTAHAYQFRHSGKFLDVLGLALKNAFLGLLTLTLYRFWARTSMRRRIWSRTWIMDDPLEYSGTAGELLRGFLLALPTFFLPAAFILYIAPLAVDPVIAGWLLVGLYVASVPLIAAGRYWMRRYQLSRTCWRGIRLGLGGSAWAYAFASSGWTILQGVTLGWYTPAARMQRARILWSNARFGDQYFGFEEDGASPSKGLWWPFTLGWFGLLPAYLISVFSIIGAYAAIFGAPPTIADAPAQPAIYAAIAAIVALTLILSLLFWSPYEAAAMNRVASRISLDGARFKLRAKTFSLFWACLLGNTLVVLSLGALAPIAGYLRVRYVLNRLEMDGAPRFAEIGQSVIAGPRAGESLGEAFDLDLGVGVV